MQPFVSHQGIVLPLDRSDVDTDAIIPKQYLKSTERTGYGAVLFDDWRYQDRGTLDSDHSHRRLNWSFVLNEPRYKHASILLARHNFGCGSSREHAVWALYEYGFRCVIASGFADIFYANCFNSGLLPIVLSAQKIDALFRRCSRDTDQAQVWNVDLEHQRIQLSSRPSADRPGADEEAAVDHEIVFDIEPAKRRNLLKGLDRIGWTLEYASHIDAYEQAHGLGARA